MNTAQVLVQCAEIGLLHLQLGFYYGEVAEPTNVRKA